MANGSFAEHLAAHRRLCILRVLAGQPGYSGNESVMQTALGGLGHDVSRDQVRTDFAWLAEQGLASVEVVSEKVHVARLTGRGVDVSRGVAEVPGVKKPRP